MQKGLMQRPYEKNHIRQGAVLSNREAVELREEQEFIDRVHARVDELRGVT
ncbi:hypothetical protein GA0115244_10781, partial [Streptomyces sp. DvalAA-19]